MTTYPLQALGGSGRLLNIAPANGFPPETYLPMLRPLLDEYRVVSLLPRGLWDGEPIPAIPGTWKTDFAADLLAGLAQHDLTGVVGIGHSFGGIATMLAALEQPARFSAVVLLDPTILALDVLELLRQSRERGTIAVDFPLAARAAKRVRQFASRDDAYTYFRTRGVFRAWDDAALREYIAHGLREHGGGVTLAWSPEWETYYFTTGYPETWETVAGFDGVVPTLIVRGGESDTYTAESAAQVRALLPSATHIEIAGHGHLFPQSAPTETAAAVGAWLRDVRGSLG